MIKRYTDISKFPDGTFFYVTNGGWTGYVTTEKGKKVCYSGADKKQPTKKFVSRFIVTGEEELVVDNVDPAIPPDTDMIMDQLVDIMTELDSRYSCSNCIVPELMDENWTDLCEEAIRLLNLIK